MPAMRTKPPAGIARIAYSVSPTVREYSLGPNPMENSSTLMPESLPTAKCPNSWTVITETSTRMNAPA